MPECKCTTHIISIFVKKHIFRHNFLFMQVQTKLMSKSEGQCLGFRPPVTQFQGQILRAAANNRVCGHASTCGHAPTSPTSTSFPATNTSTKY